MAADVGADVMRAELLLDQLHRAEDRPLRAAGAKAGRAGVDVVGDVGRRLSAGSRGAFGGARGASRP